MDKEIDKEVKQYSEPCKNCGNQFVITKKGYYQTKVSCGSGLCKIGKI